MTESMEQTRRKLLPQAGGAAPGLPRVFLAFEERGRDVSGLLEFGTVMQVFESDTPWQVTSATAPGMAEAFAGYFKAHDFTDDDYVVAIGDPVAIALIIHAAAEMNRGRVKVLRWDRLPCAKCGTYRGKRCTAHALKNGRYSPVALKLRHAANASVEA